MSYPAPFRLTDTPPVLVDVLYIANPDGTPRWMWPTASRRPEFLSFYPVVTWRQRVFTWCVRLVFLLRLQAFVFAATRTARPAGVGDTRDWALFTGTVGPNRKQVVIRDRHSVAKQALGPASRWNLDNEHFALRKLNRHREQFPFVFPRLLNCRRDQLVMQRLPDAGTWDHLTANHVEALQALRAAFAERNPLAQWIEWPDIRQRLDAVEAAADPRIPGDLLRELRQMMQGLDGTRMVDYGFSHGDFTPWNTLRTQRGQLGIIDWELAREEMPAGYDFFHFHLQQGILVERQQWSAIYAAIRRNLTPSVALALFGSTRVDVDFYLRLYLLHHLSYYLEVYARQEAWHQQIQWQLDVWQDALRALAPAACDRPEVIRQLFRRLGNTPYAVLKLGDADPAALPLGSDLDILLTRSSAEAVIRQLESAPGVDRVRAVRKSFMASLAVTLTDGELLYLDLIWKLKRRGVVFMEVVDLIRRSYRNPYGVFAVNRPDTEDYLRLFYGLNGQPVPARYAVGEGALPQLPAEPNRGWNGLRNRIDYAIDALVTAWSDRGFLVTFSGVDGAGKSTVIEAVTGLIDKQFRRRVKVLRHRPSLLPILSAYVHGKEAAEQRSVDRLPRTGTNRNVLSSLLRFAYYYADYLFGQAYIYVRYVLRGYAVVYDRYYYDFMLDARRSNIAIPAWVPRWGLPFLLKPDYNFFLYADADTILARKRELDRATIVDLTTRYRGLFDECQRRYPRRVFANVENIELDETLALLTATLKSSIR